ncbi:MAG: adenylosuccinate lyase, partial [Clostridia bacterium]|nr:adenylosuccinate lyase [Clostridia bacterium]
VGNRQELQERIRVLSMEAGKHVKVECNENNLIELIQKDELFRPVWDRLDGILEPKNFIGRAPSQTVEFIEREIDPILSKHAELLGEKGELRV